MFLVLNTVESLLYGLCQLDVTQENVCKFIRKRLSTSFIKWISTLQVSQQAVHNCALPLVFVSSVFHLPLPPSLHSQCCQLSVNRSSNCGTYCVVKSELKYCLLSCYHILFNVLLLVCFEVYCKFPYYQTFLPIQQPI